MYYINKLLRSKPIAKDSDNIRNKFLIIVNKDRKYSDSILSIY